MIREFDNKLLINPFKPQSVTYVSSMDNGRVAGVTGQFSNQSGYENVDY